jgi:peptidoglycan/xylan/chitin deacetylase (PgdA/CDA1 family)
MAFVMLHGVMDTEEASQWQPSRSYLSRKSLNASLSLLSRYFEFISIEDALELIRTNSPLKKNYCILTFDDGLKNNLTHAMPILRKYKAPAVMYVVPGQIAKQEPFWFDRLDYAIQHAIDHIDKIDIFDKTIAVSGQSKNRAYCKQLLLKVKSEIFYSNHPEEKVNGEMNKVISELESASGKSLLDIYQDDPWSKLMDWDEIQKAAHSVDITIGSHTVDHTMLGTVGETEIMNQLDNSKKIIEDNTLKACQHFCFPDGSVPSNPEKYLKQSGYASAVTTKPGLTLPNNFNQYLINRYHMPIEDDEVFTLAWVSGFIDSLKRAS